MQKPLNWGSDTPVSSKKIYDESSRLSKRASTHGSDGVDINLAWSSYSAGEDAKNHSLHSGHKSPHESEASGVSVLTTNLKSTS